MDDILALDPGGTLLRTLELGDVIQTALVVTLAFAAVTAVERIVPPIADRLSAAARSAILPWIPVFRLGVLALTAMILIPIMIEPGTESLIGLIGAGAVAIGFAFKDYLTSILAGIVVLFERPYRQGDWVRIGDVYGEVREMGMRAARLVTPEDNVVTVPHGEIWTSMIQNANDGSATLLCTANFYVHPDHDAESVHRSLGDAALASPWIDVSKPLSVSVRERPWGTHYRVNGYPICSADQFRFVSDVTVRGKGLLAELGARPAVASPVTLPKAD